MLARCAAKMGSNGKACGVCACQRFVRSMVPVMVVASPRFNVSTSGLAAIAPVCLFKALRTSVIVAHRLATAARADRIAVVDASRVVEYGTHEDLLAGGGMYRRLWESDRTAPV